MYKLDLALNNPKSLICHITKPNQTIISLLACYPSHLESLSLKPLPYVLHRKK